MDLTAFFPRRSHDATQTFLSGFHRVLDDRGLKLNPTECDDFPAKPLASDTHPPEAQAGWKVGPLDFCLRKRREKMDRGTLVLLRFGFDAGVPQELPRRDQPSRHYSRGVALGTTLRSRPPFTRCFFFLCSRTAAQPPFGTASDTPDPDPSAAETQFRRNTKRPGGWIARHARNATCPTCPALTLWTF